MSKTASSIHYGRAARRASPRPAAAQKQAPAAAERSRQGADRSRRRPACRRRRRPDAVAGAGRDDSGPRVDLTADEAVARALERNVTLASQRLTPQTFDYALAATLRLLSAERSRRRSATQSQTQLGRPTIDGGDTTNQRHRELERAASRRTCGGAAATTGQLDQQPRSASNAEQHHVQPAYYSSGSRRSTSSRCCANFKIDNTRTHAPDDRRFSRTSPSSICRRRRPARWRRCATPTGSWCTRVRPSRASAALARPRVEAGAGQPRRASRSARWRRSTSCRRRPRKRRGARRSSTPRRRCRTTSWR